MVDGIELRSDECQSGAAIDNILRVSPAHLIYADNRRSLVSVFAQIIKHVEKDSESLLNFSVHLDDAIVQIEIVLAPTLQKRVGRLFYAYIWRLRLWVSFMIDNKFSVASVVDRIATADMCPDPVEVVTGSHILYRDVALSINHDLNTVIRGLGDDERSLENLWYQLMLLRNEALRRRREVLKDANSTGFKGWFSRCEKCLRS